MVTPVNISQRARMYARKGEPTIVVFIDSLSLSLFLPWEYDSLGLTTGNQTEWLHYRLGKNIRISQRKRIWSIAKTHLNRLVDALVEEYGKACLFRQYNPMTKCSYSCRTARGYECECSCQGEFHGTEARAGVQIVPVSEHRDLLFEGRRFSEAHFSGPTNPTRLPAWRTKGKMLAW
jgi:hypothetical protein